MRCLQFHITCGCDTAVHMYFEEMQLDSCTATHHKITDFFEAEDLQESILCQEADLTADNINGSTDVHLYTLAKTPVDINALEKELEFYHADDAKIFVHGFPLNDVGPHLPSKSRNLKSAITRPEITQQIIDKEVAEGRVGGPFAYPPSKLEGFTTGTCRKEKKTSCDFRLIHHLSYPQNESVNDYIDPKLCFVKYASFDEAVALVQNLEQGCLLGKSDIKMHSNCCQLQ